MCDNDVICAILTAVDGAIAFSVALLWAYVYIDGRREDK